MSQSTLSTSKMRLNYIDSLRGLAAFYVLLHHEFLQVWPNGYPGPSPFQKFLALFRFGHYSVDLFIVLSGFSLMLPLVLESKKLKVETQNFVLRRARRILPPYYFAVGLSLVLIKVGIHQKTGTHWDQSLPVTLRSIWTHLLLLHDVFGEDTTINHALWSIAVEFRIYFFFPVLIFLWRSIGGFKTTAFAVGLSLILYKGFEYFLGVNLTVHYLGLFAMGMLAAWISYGPSKEAGRGKQYNWGRITVLLLPVVAFIFRFQMAGRISTNVSEGFCILYFVFFTFDVSNRLSEIYYITFFKLGSASYFRRLFLQSLPDPFAAYSGFVAVPFHPISTPTIIYVFMSIAYWNSSDCGICFLVSCFLRTSIF